MKVFFCTAFLLLFASASLFSQTLPPEENSQIWNEIQVTIPLVKSKDKKVERVSLFLFGTLRQNSNLEYFIDRRIGFGFDFRINDRLRISPSYFYRYGQPFRGRREFENRLRLDVNWEKNFEHFTIKNRSRIEHRLNNSRSDITRYRNRVQFIFPIKKDNKKFFDLFVGTEPFYEIQSKRWTRNEFSVGIIKKLTPHFSTEFFYTLQNNQGNFLKYVNIFGANLKVKID